jgi:hypothetical protein
MIAITVNKVSDDGEGSLGNFERLMRATFSIAKMPSTLIGQAHSDVDLGSTNIETKLPTRAATFRTTNRCEVFTEFDSL